MSEKDFIPSIEDIKRAIAEPTIEDLKRQVEEADALAQMKSNFLATMSHEIRTPMQTIFGLLELIADEKASEKTTTMAHTAQEAASGLLQILDDILDLAKIDADKMELDVFEVPVRTLVRGILEAMAVKVHGVAVELIDDIQGDVPFVVIGDPKRMRQIIINLVGNALKFTHAGSVRVRVSKDVQEVKVKDGQVGLRFEVIDTGIGMSEEVCSRLFQSFSQADNSTQRKYGGTGLGLSISKKLVALMGGAIGVSSVEGQGSTFWFEIPTQEVSVDTTTIELPDLDGISVVSVEDHPQGAKEIVKSLRSMGASVESCPTYAEGLDLMRKRPFDVAVIDQGLPDGLGLDLIKEVAEIRPNMGLVMYTVRDDPGLTHSLQALGVKYLTKPASRAGLGEAVKAAASRAERLTIDGPRRLLIAEDTEGVRKVLAMQLEKLGVEADFAQNGAEAMRMLESGAYGLLITDLHMPEIDGYGVVNRIRAQERASGVHFPVVVLTADVQMAQREAYLRHGFDECLLKPVSLGQFRRLMIRWGLLDEESGVRSREPDTETRNPKPETHLAAIDTEMMRQQMGDFGANEIQMLGMFVGMTAPIVEKIKAAQGAKDFYELAEAAHSLKGAARSACALILGDLAAELQENAESRQDSAAVIDMLMDEFKRVDEEIRRLQAG